MQSLSAVIVDDERLARKELRRLLLAHPTVEIVAEASSLAQAKELVEQHQPDLLFLDIEMPGGSGFELLPLLDHLPTVIFTTAYDTHALKAFDVNALDYLLKPIEPRRLAEALSRVRQSAKSDPSSYLDQVFVRDQDRCWFVKLSTVPLLESEGNYARLHLPGKQPLLQRSLNYLEEKLDPALFFRASRRHLINLSAIVGIEPGSEGRLLVHLSNGVEVEMSRRQSQHFKERMSP